MKTLFLLFVSSLVFANPQPLLSVKYREDLQSEKQQIQSLRQDLYSKKACEKEQKQLDCFKQILSQTPIRSIDSLVLLSSTGVRAAQLDNQSLPRNEIEKKRAVIEAMLEPFERMREQDFLLQTYKAQSELQKKEIEALKKSEAKLFQELKAKMATEIYVLLKEYYGLLKPNTPSQEQAAYNQMVQRYQALNDLHLFL